ncbi:MAG TPA: response regulator, partial [Chloroflexota bacterium]|nr:response regulator [Chloroflexota bacterium]
MGLTASIVPSREKFPDLVRDALGHLYDAAYLQTHPLALVLASASPDRAPFRGKLLFQALLDAIEALHPPTDKRIDSPAWRTYRILELRYLDGSNVTTVLEQLAISKTQFQRDHSRALEAVALLLWDRWGLDGVTLASPPPPEPREALALTEAAELVSRMNPEYLDVPELLRSLIALLRPASEESRVQLTLGEPATHLPPVYADRISLRQIFLGLLSAALECGPGGIVRVSTEWREHRVEIRFVTAPGASAPTAREIYQRGPELGVVRSLTTAAHGEIRETVDEATGCWTVTLALPAERRPLVLVIDNNADFVNLVGRYLAVSQWVVSGAGNVDRGQALAAELQPNVVLLDVMMPGRDGWDLLVELRSHPETRRVPVIVCSILHEPSIARALGAVGYLPK